MGRTSQTEIVLNELLAKKRITQLEFSDNFRITRLSALIFILKGRGVKVDDMWCYPLDRPKYKEYYLSNAEIKRIKKERKEKNKNAV